MDSEILVIDSSCSKIYKKMIMQICEKFKKAKYIYLKQIDFKWSKTAAHNLGIKMAKSKYIITTDIDAYPCLRLENLMRPIIKKNRNKNLFFSRYKFVKEIGFKPYFEDDLETIENAVNLRQTKRRGGAKGGLQLASSDWFKKHLYISKIGWGGMDREKTHYSWSCNLNRYSGDKIWIYHIAHQNYKKIGRAESLQIRREGENLLKMRGF